MSICQSNSWHDRVWVLSVITQSKERKKWSSVVTSLNRSSIVCLSPRWTHAVLQNIPACMGKSQSVCAIITQPQDNFWLQSVVRPPPLSKKKNAENSQKALEASYVWRHLNPCLAHTGVLAFPLHRLFSNSRDAQTFPLRYFWTLCRF